MKKDNKTDETYVPLSRGLIGHLDKMSASELKVYIWLLIRAGFKGKYKGKVNSTFREIGKELNMDIKTAWEACQKLKQNSYIDYIPAKNQWDESKFEVKKYKAVEDFNTTHKHKRGRAMGVDTQSKKDIAIGIKTHSDPTATQQQPNSTFDKTNGKGKLQNRNNVNNVKNVLREDSSLKNPLEDKLREALSDKRIK